MIHSSYTNKETNYVCNSIHIPWRWAESSPGSFVCVPSQELARCRCLPLRPLSWTPPPRRYTRGRASRSGRSSVFCPGRPAGSWARPRSRGLTQPSGHRTSPPCQTLAPAPGPSASGEPVHVSRCNSSMRNELLLSGLVTWQPAAFVSGGRIWIYRMTRRREARLGCRRRRHRVISWSVDFPFNFEADE